MIPMIYTVFYIGVALHLVTAATALAYAATSRDARLLRLSGHLLLGALVAHACVFVLRYVAWNVVPLAGVADSFNLFIFLVSLTSYAVTRSQKRQALLTFYTPVLAALCLIAVIVTARSLGESPRALPIVLVTIHVGLAFLAYALFFVASLTGGAYAFAARQLKRLNTVGFAQKLPSLENMDRTLYLLIAFGYPVFVVTLVLGVAWAWYDTGSLTSSWWWSPKIIWSVVMVALYAFSFHARSLGLLRGPKLAHLICIGFGFMLSVYLVLELLHLLTYNFYQEAP